MAFSCLAASSSRVSLSGSIFSTLRLKVNFRFLLQQYSSRAMRRPKPANEPSTPPAIVPGGVEGFAACDACDAAALEPVGFGHSLDVEVALVLLLLCELGAAVIRFKVSVVGGAVVVRVVSETTLRTPKAMDED